MQSTKIAHFAINNKEAEGWVENVARSMRFPVEFDFEDYGYLPSDDGIYAELLGPQQDGSIHWYGIYAGGDWEVPVYLALFRSDEKIRCIIPYANNYNQETNTAWDNEEEDYWPSNEDIESLRNQVIEHINTLRS